MINEKCQRPSDKNMSGQDRESSSMRGTDLMGGRFRGLVESGQKVQSPL